MVKSIQVQKKNLHNRFFFFLDIKRNILIKKLKRLMKI